MLKPNSRKYPRMSREERKQFEQAVAEEQAAKEKNIAAAKKLIPRLMADCQQAVAIVRMLRQAREAAGITLTELEARTGIRKSALSRLENSKAPNPTLASLQRYAEALGRRLCVSVEAERSVHRRKRKQ
jgi:DNA-binding Xre family transcriptional regulator